MTYEELEKAHKEQTWLVWHTTGDSDELCRVSAGDIDILCDVRTASWVWGEEAAYAQELRIATPNDMLKYRE